MNIRHIALLSLLLILGACASGDGTPAGDPNPRAGGVPTEIRITLPESLGDLETVDSDGPFPVHVGESILLEPIGLIFTFVEVSNDSRCPLDGSILCFWEGVATVVIRAALAGDGLTEEIMLNTTDKNGWSRSGRILGHTIRLDLLEPFPTGGDPGLTPPDPESYHAVFTIID